MRLHTLELTGFGPFRETQRVDFDAFADDGVFLISGRTGTGKSSILDGVSFALYGTVPRYDGSEKRLRSDHCFVTDPTEVRLEFTIGDSRWRVTRAPEYDRPAKRGGGFTTAPARAELEQLVDGVWIARAAKPREVGIALSELLGLNAQQFQQVILLAQNKFSRFLLAPGDERQTLLRTLFGTRRFEQYRDALEERRRAAQKQTDAASEHARTLLELAERLVAADTPATAADTPATAADTAGRRDALVAAQTRADYRVEQAAMQRDLADEASTAAVADHAALTARAQSARERATLTARLTELESRAEHVVHERARLHAARAAEVLRAPLESADRAATARDAAATAATAALSAWTDAGGEASVDIAARIDELTAARARWTDAAALEQGLPGVTARLEGHATEIAEIDVALATLGERLALIPQQRDALDADITQARTVAARREDLHRLVEAIAAQQAAAHEVEALAAQAADAERAHLAANVASAEAAAAVTALLQRRLAGYAGELSAALVDGEPCAVCGATAHPHPAEPTDAPVTDDDLAAAERTRDAAHAAAVAAADVARDVRELLSAARARAGDDDAATLETRHAQAHAEAVAADAAFARLDDLLAQRAGLDERVEAATRERVELGESRDAARVAHAAAVTERAQAESAITTARGAFPTVAARIADGDAERARAHTLLEARAALAESERALAATVADRDARLTAAGIADADAARAALLPAAETAEIEAQLTEYEADARATRARLLDLDLELAGADDDVTDDELAASAEAVESADRARAAAIAAERDAQLAAGRLRELSEQVDDAYAEVAGIAEDAEAVTRLADTVAGRAPNTMKMDLETFVLAAELEEIVAAANLRLSEMSSGRYTLHHSDARAARGRASGLGIEVLDAHTGKLRSPQSLSGGETFLASLALALGLGEVVTSRAGGIRLDTLFVDEGFGSLDPETLDLAMHTLDELRAGGRTVGVISHVEAMKEQLPAQLVVEATGEGPSIIRQDVTAGV